ncbi:hypothetical protein [Echinicola shivajiensis]|uniref:hypothetical protein n=1 Tax=Echinicola shivajiensis TaxID=1035916 RepID=UPI001BFC1619|nr:hypothetical protein [Echinicola shivajiensis]
MRIFIYLFPLLCCKLSLALALQETKLYDFSEQVYIHKSKSIAVTGETVPFSVDIRSHDKPTFSKMAYADLISREGERMTGTIIPLESGKANAYLTIPTGIPSDHYLLRVYSRLASSLGNENHYHHSLITVINPEIPPQGSQQIGKAWEERSVKSPIKLSLSKETLAQTEEAELIITAPLSKDLSISISKKNPYLPDLKVKRLDTEIHQPRSYELIPELRGHIIKGAISGSQIDTTQVYFLSAHGKKSDLFLGKPNKNGQVFFEMGAMKDYDFLLLQTEQDTVPFGMSIQHPFAPAPNEELLAFPPLQLAEKDMDLLNDMVISSSTTGYYFKPEESIGQTIITGFDADRAYHLDNYNRFADVATTLKEYVPTVMVRKNGGKYHFKLSNFPEDRMFKNNPLMLIDAMPVFDSDDLGKHRADSIERIEVVNRNFYILDNIFEGVINIKSYHNDFGGFPIPDRALYLEYPKIQQAVDWKFNSPLKEEEDRLPDFRTILFWDENIHVDEEGKAKIKFTTSQIPGEYEIKVSSISSDGIQHWSKMEFEVLGD